DLALRITGFRPGETSFLQPLGTDPESASVPHEDLQPITLAVAEQEQVPAQRVTRQTIADETVQPLEPLAHVGDSRSQIDPCSWAQSKHGLHPLQHTHQALERTRIKITMHFDPAPARQHHGQPTTTFLLPRRFPSGQFYRHQTTGRRNSSTHSLPTPLPQMAIQSAEAQTSTVAKLAPPHTAAHKLSHQLLNFRSCTSLGRRCLLLFSVHPFTSPQTSLIEQVRCSDAYTQCPQALPASARSRMRAVSARADVGGIGYHSERRSQSRDRNRNEPRLNVPDIGIFIGPICFR